MTIFTDHHGAVLATDTFTSPCVDCGDPIEVVDGQSKPHDCPMPEQLRGRVGQAWADGERWVLEHPEQYGLQEVPTDG